MCLDGIEPPELRIELQPPAGQQSQSRAAALSRDTHRAHTALKAHDYNAAIKKDNFNADARIDYFRSGSLVTG